MIYKFHNMQHYDAVATEFNIAKSYLETYTCIRIVPERNASDSHHPNGVIFTVGFVKEKYLDYDIVSGRDGEQNYINICQYGCNIVGVLRVLLRLVGIDDFITYKSSSIMVDVFFTNMRPHCLELFERRSTEITADKVQTKR
ncbi:hypothetical protein MTO96_026743 [Rhipicephalus appendiculatus]